MTLIPGRHGRWVKPGIFDAPVEINSAGFRDREHELTKPAGTRRVLLLGDSFVEALQVPFEQSITPLLEQRLRNKWPDTEVIAVGASGWGTARQYLALREYGLRYKPDLVLLFFVGNDFSDNSRRLQGLAYAPYPQTTPDGKVARDEAGNPVFTSAKKPGFRFITGVLREYSKSYRFGRVVMNNSSALYAFYGLLGRLGFTSAPDSLYARAADNFGYHEIYRPELKPSWAEAWEITEEMLLDVRNLARDNGARFGVVLVPASWEVDPQVWEGVQTDVPAMRHASLDLDRPSTRLDSFLSANGVPVINPLREFREHSRTSPPLYLPSDGHWTAAGHQLAADLLKEPVAALLETDPRRSVPVHAGRHP